MEKQTLTDDLRQSIIEYRQEGMNYARIARKLGLARDTVRTFLLIQMNHIDLTRSNKRWTPEEDKILVKEYRLNIGIQMIAKKLNRSVSSCVKRLSYLRTKNK